MSDLEAPLSTVIDIPAAPAASGGGTPNLTDGKEAAAPTPPPSLREDIEAAFKEDDAEKESGDKKPEKEAPAKPADEAGEKEAKEEPKPEEKPAEEGAAEKPAEPEDKPGEKGDERTHKEPPKSFLPDSREVWKNVPRVVRRDIETMTRDHEAEVAQYRERTERYEAIKEYDELARSNGIELKDSLKRVAELENLIQANPLAGLNRILIEAGPRKADGQPFSLFEVADFIVRQGPDGYQKLVAQRQPEKPQGPSEVEKLRGEIEALKAESRAAPIITAFAAKNPRYYELEGDIAFFLQSDRISPNLSPEDRLAAAYGMAERINPVSTPQDRPSAEGEDTERRAGEDFGGSKSIKSSPGATDEEVDDQAKGGEPIRESIRRAARSLRAA